MNLRLLLFKDCNRRCKGCCNKGFDLDSLTVCTGYKGYDCIILTGGEPMLKPEIIKKVVGDIRKQTDKPIYVYTAKYDDKEALLEVLELVDGITVTLHVKRDAEVFNSFNEMMKGRNITGKSLRLNVFYNVPTKGLDLSMWKVKKNIRWIKDCPLPTNEVFMRMN